MADPNTYEMKDFSTGQAIPQAQRTKITRMIEAGDRLAASKSPLPQSTVTLRNVFTKYRGQLAGASTVQELRTVIAAMKAELGDAIARVDNEAQKDLQAGLAASELADHFRTVAKALGV